MIGALDPLLVTIGVPGLFKTSVFS